MASLTCAIELKRLGERSALLLWNEVVAWGWLGNWTPQSTQDLEARVRAFYRQNPRGELLPIRQAMRLVGTHFHLQIHLSSVTERLVELGRLRSTLKEKIAQLRALGEEPLEAQTSLERFERDLNALESVQKGFQASCHRLEAILISVEQTAQVSRLHAEISALTAPQNGAVLVAPEEDLLGIERQIGREIETFLELERETDRHFR